MRLSVLMNGIHLGSVQRTLLLKYRLKDHKRPHKTIKKLANVIRGQGRNPQETKMAIRRNTGIGQAHFPRFFLSHEHNLAGTAIA